MKTISEQLRALEATRAAKAARMQTLMQLSMDEGRTMNEAELEEFDSIDAEVKTIDADLVRMHRLEQLSGQAATRPVIDPTRTDDPVGNGAQQRAQKGPQILIKRADPDDKFKGQSFTRKIIARALATIEQRSIVAIAEERYGKTNPNLVAVIKANEVAGGGSASGEWGAELVALDGRYTGDFITLLQAATVYDKLPLREVPANITIKGQDGAATGYWVGQAKAIPASKADFSSVNLTPLKVAAIATISNELIRDSSPSAEALVQQALIDASSQRVDTTFLSSTAASAGVSPAGLLNGLSAISSAGNTVEDIRADVLALYAPFFTAKNASGLYYAMNPALAKALSLVVNALGQIAFPGLGATGGTFLGDPVVTGDNVNSAYVVLLKPSDIYKIGDTGVSVSISQQATIEQNSSPTGDGTTPTAASATLVSTFQEEMTAIKVVRSINFAKRRSSAVAYIDDAAYGTITSP